MIPTLRPPIFASVSRPENAQAYSRPLSIPRSLDPSIPAALVRAPGDCRPNGYYDWTPGGNPPRRDPPEHHGPRRLHASLIVLGVTVTVYLILFTAGMAWVCVFGK